MTGMTMPEQTWYGAAAGYLGVWMAMMVPMMLPSLVPMLSRYRRSVRAADGIHLHGLTALVGVGYFVIWAVLGAAGVQLTPWKARQLALCRGASGCGCPPAPNALGAWRHGLRVGVRCSLCC